MTGSAKRDRHAVTKATAMVVGKLPMKSPGFGRQTSQGTYERMMATVAVKTGGPLARGTLQAALHGSIPRSSLSM